MAVSSLFSYGGMQERINNMIVNRMLIWKDPVLWIAMILLTGGSVAGLYFFYHSLSCASTANCLSHCINKATDGSSGWDLKDLAKCRKGCGTLPADAQGQAKVADAEEWCRARRALYVTCAAIGVSLGIVLITFATVLMRGLGEKLVEDAAEDAVV